jgi:hypothetical protein
MRWIGYLTAAAVALVWATRHPDLATAVTLAVLVAVGWWASHGTRAPSTGFGSRITAVPAGGRCGACAVFVADIAAHEAGHAVTAEALGYTVTGAVVYGFGDGGFTTVPGWGNNPWHTMVMAAAGRAGENRKRIFFTADLNGGRNDKWTDAWWVHRLAPQVAAERGITAAQAIALAEAEADRLISASAGQWQKYTDVLTRDGSFGDVT